MKRTKLWWSMLTCVEKSELKKAEMKLSRINRGKYIGLDIDADNLRKRRAALIAKADNAVIMEQTMRSQLYEESQDENQSL